MLCRRMFDLGNQRKSQISSLRFCDLLINKLNLKNLQQYCEIDHNRSLIETAFRMGTSFSPSQWLKQIGH